MKNALCGLLLAAFCVGCDSLPNVLVPAGPAATDYIPLVASAIGVVNASADEVDVPVPDGSSAICKNCKGKGKIGDGRTMVTCPVCDGSGKGKSSGEAAESTEAAQLPTIPLDPASTEDREPLKAAMPEAAIEPTSEPATTDEKPGMNFKPEAETAKDELPATPPDTNPVMATLYVAADFHCPGCDVTVAQIEVLRKDYGWTEKQLKVVPITNEQAFERRISTFPTLEVVEGDKLRYRRASVFTASQLCSIINPIRAAATAK